MESPSHHTEPRTLIANLFSKYLGRILTENDDDTRSIETQLTKARHRWNSNANILKSEGANAPTMAAFYKTVVAVLLYGADS